MAAEKVEVDAMSDSPTDFWNSEKEKRTVMRLKVRTPKEPQKNDKVSEFFRWLLRIDAIDNCSRKVIYGFFTLVLLWRRHSCEKSTGKTRERSLVWADGPCMAAEVCGQQWGGGQCSDPRLTVWVFILKVFAKSLQPVARVKDNWLSWYIEH